MITPTVGRVVLVYGSNVNGDRDNPAPALIVRVWGDRMINVGGFNQNGNSFGACSVPLLQDDDMAPTDGRTYATWMPFQKGQAAKTEALEAALAAK